MTKTPDYTLYDENGQTLRKLVTLFPDLLVHVLTLPSGGRQFKNVSTFSDHGDPIRLSDTIEVSRSAKRSFLLTAPAAIIVATDLRSVEFLISAIKFMIEGSIRRLLTITTLPIQGILNTMSKDERRTLDSNRTAGAFVIAGDIMHSSSLEWLRQLDGTHQSNSL